MIAKLVQNEFPAAFYISHFIKKQNTSKVIVFLHENHPQNKVIYEERRTEKKIILTCYYQGKKFSSYKNSQIKQFFHYNSLTKEVEERVDGGKMKISIFLCSFNNSSIRRAMKKKIRCPAKIWVLKYCHNGKETSYYFNVECCNHICGEYLLRNDNDMAVKRKVKAPKTIANAKINQTMMLCNVQDTNTDIIHNSNLICDGINDNVMYKDDEDVQVELDILQQQTENYPAVIDCNPKKSGLDGGSLIKIYYCNVDITGDIGVVFNGKYQSLSNASTSEIFVVDRIKKIIVCDIPSYKIEEMVNIVIVKYAIVNGVYQMQTICSSKEKIFQYKDEKSKFENYSKKKINVFEYDEELKSFEKSFDVNNDDDLEEFASFNEMEGLVDNNSGNWEDLGIKPMYFDSI